MFPFDPLKMASNDMGEKSLFWRSVGRFCGISGIWLSAPRARLGLSADLDATTHKILLPCVWLLLVQP